MQRSMLLGVLLGVLVFGLTNFGSAYAETFTAIQDGNWNSPATWNSPTGPGVPTDEDDVIIPNGITVDIIQETEAGFVTNNGILNISSGFGIFETSSNSGQINISSSGSTIEVEIDADFVNSGTIINDESLFLSESRTISNSGTITNNGNIDNTAIVITTGFFNNFNKIDNNNEFRNDVDGDFTNNPGSFVTNFGILTNFESITNDGTISNSGTITNDAAGTFTNNDFLSFDCDGIVIGVITGNQPIEICSDNPPVFTSFPADIITSTDLGENFATVEYDFPLAFDGIDPASVDILTPLYTSGVQFPLGVTTVTYEAIDGQGQSTIQSFFVTVNDLEPPVFSGVPSDITQDSDAGLDTAVVSWTPPTASDNVDGSVAVTQTAGPASGGVFPLGSTLVTYEATDTQGNVGNVSFTVTITDDQPPVFSGVPSSFTQSTDLGLDTAVVSWTPPTASDNVDGSVAVTQTAGPASGGVFPLGLTTITYEATDSAGNTETASFTVTITDDQPPVFSGVPSSFTQSTDLGLDTSIVIWVAPTASDNVDGSVAVTQTAGPASGGVFPLGSTLVTYEATDSAGNTETASFTVTITDDQPPVFSGVPTDIMVPTDLGLDTAVVSWTPPTASDNVDGSVAVTQTAGPASGGVFPLGLTTITYEATDSAGNTVTGSFDVTVSDSEVPMISGVPDDIIVSLPVGDTSVPVTWIEPTAADNGGIASFESTHSPSESFTLGTTQVTYTATDNVGNITTASFNITVIASVFTAVVDGDWDDPLTWGGIVPPNNDNKIIPDGITVSNSGILTNSGTIEITGTLNNECGAFISNSGIISGNPVSEILCEPILISPEDGAQINDTKPDLVWENPDEIRSIAYSTVLEDSSNPGIPIELVSLSLVSAEPQNNVFDENYSWSVSVDLAIDYDPGYSFIPVSTPVSSTFEIVINDVEPPVISEMPDDLLQVMPEGQTTMEVFWIKPTASDNVDVVVSLTSNFVPHNTLGEGVYEVIYTATDSSGNSSTASFTMTVTPFDDTPPAISGIPDDIIATLPKGDTSVPVTWIEPTATDNIGVTSFTSTHSSGDSFPIGDTIVTYTASDLLGNTFESSFTITVLPGGKFVEPELQDLSRKQIKFFDKLVDKWEHEIEKLEKENSKLEDRAQKYEDRGNLDKAEKLRERIASNEAEIAILVDEIAVVQVSSGDIPVQDVEVEVHEDLSSKAYAEIEREIKFWEKKLKRLNYVADKLEDRAQKYEDRGNLDKAENIRKSLVSVNAEIAVIEDLIEVLVCAIDFELDDDHKPHHGHDDDDKKGKGHDKHHDDDD